MIHYRPNNKSSEVYQKLFQQGASEIIQSGNSHIALWTANTPLLNNQPIATIGGCQFFNHSDGVELLSYTTKFLSQRFRSIVGPMNGNTWLDHRLVTFSDDSPSFLLEPNTSPEWFNIFQEAGFSTLSQYSSSRIELNIQTNIRYKKLYLRLQSKGVQIRPLKLDQFTQDLTAIYELSCDAFKNNFLYTKIPLHLFLEKYEMAKTYLDPDLILIAEKEGEAIGFVFCYPDLTIPETLIVKTLASHSEKSVSGIGNLLVDQVHQKAYNKGYRNAIHALQFNNNSSLKITSRYDPKVIRKYAIMVKSY